MLGRLGYTEGSQPYIVAWTPFVFDLANNSAASSAFRRRAGGKECDAG